MIDLSKLRKPDYTGSVQELYFSEEHPEWMVCKTMPGGSVFDVGTIFSIPNSDICRTALRHKIYSLLETPDEWENIYNHICRKYAQDKEFLAFLCEGLLEDFRVKGANTHHLGMIDRDTGELYGKTFPPHPSQYVLVKKYKIIKPFRVSYNNNHLWDYSEYYGADKFVIPLENIVRIGVTSGSSIYRKYMNMDDQERKNYLNELGLRQDLVPWTVFTNPIVDFTTKYEPEDRNLSLQEALHISGNNGEKLLDIIRMSILGAILVSEFFKKLGLFLWDLKWEIARDGDKLVFVDTIDTDSIRVTAKTNYRNKYYFVNFNKQSVRDYYKIMHSEWFEATRSAKASALKSGKSFLEHLQAGQAEGYYPGTPRVDQRFIDIQEDKFNTLIAYVYGQADLDSIIEKYNEIGQKEIRYYDSNGVLDEYGKLNGI
ncbi:MAG: phosphoribosylaminoimidazole-succinocarboxamide synthase [Pelotomaculum sp. PtaU1.Bin035]|nr:MAG: phosphoribosylaminoimidazole-succinocarboxamide synthase [Pelotomaculum sp. PtaU1.Bin035]